MKKYPIMGILTAVSFALIVAVIFYDTRLKEVEKKSQSRFDSYRDERDTSNELRGEIDRLEHRLKKELSRPKPADVWTRLLETPNVRSIHLYKDTSFFTSWDGELKFKLIDKELSISTFIRNGNPLEVAEALLKKRDEYFNQLKNELCESGVTK